MILRPARARTLIFMALGTVAFATGALVGCTPRSAPTPTPTAVFATEKEAFAAAEEAYMAYNEAFNAIDLTDPSTFEPVFARTTSDFRNADKETLSELSAAGLQFVGETRIIGFKGMSSTAHFEEIVALVCIDLSESDVVNAAGDSVVPIERPAVNTLRVTFAANAGSVLIAHADREPEASCDSE
ncbi:hypothetical protein J3D45_003101 [Microbacterium foliorum]|uniref:hypothetical protein n=1 Tax=Microbacterium foliorum TaxID=104336 RepID=UPI00209FE21C|nr:hypothetical protein [Microbacterium foliorum]MCP1430603.1 hypothetical protein [Microbacterium foliorum]